MRQPPVRLVTLLTTAGTDPATAVGGADGMRADVGDVPVTFADQPEAPSFDVPGYRAGSAARGSRRGRTVTGVRRRDGTAVDIELVDLPDSADGRFLVEAATLLDLPTSPHLVPVLDVGTTTADGRTCGYVVTPRADRTLADRRAAEGPLPVDAVSAVAADAALGLCALHGADVVHGALAPNALVELASGRVAVTGCALPVLAESEAGPYSPPEVRAGGDWTVAGDLWALGTVVRGLTAPQPLPAALATLLDRLTDDDPARRPDDASRVVDELRAHRARDPLETASPAAAVPTLRGGRPLGSGYLLDEPVGRGATGQVWRGRRRSDDSPVAVKVLRSELAEDPEVVARFVAERSTLTGIQSPYLVTVLDLVAESDTLAIVMELVEGADLRVTLARGGLTTREACSVLTHVAEGLTAVHAAGVVHRDIKPENVLVGTAGGAPHAWLTDFGLARAVAPSTRRLTRASRLVGTPEYVAPELAMGRPATAAVDVYALGVLAYETLSGRRPFDADHPAALLRAHLEDEPQRPPGMGDDAWAVVTSCLAKDPTERPDASRLAAAFRSLAASASGGAALAALPAGGGATPPPYLSPWSASDGDDVRAAPLLTADATLPAPPAEAPAPPAPRRWWLWVATLLALAVVAGAAGWWFGRPDETPRAKASPSPSASLDTVPVPVVVDSPRRGVVRVRFPGGTALPGVQWFFVMRDGTVAAQRLEPTDEDWTAADLDPGTEHCWAVFAVVQPVDGSSEQSPGEAVEPVCRNADGRSE